MPGQQPSDQDAAGNAVFKQAVDDMGKGKQVAAQDGGSSIKMAFGPGAKATTA